MLTVIICVLAYPGFYFSLPPSIHHLNLNTDDPAAQ